MIEVRQIVEPVALRLPKNPALAGWLSSSARAAPARIRCCRLPAPAATTIGTWCFLAASSRGRAPARKRTTPLRSRVRRVGEQERLRVPGGMRTASKYAIPIAIEIDIRAGRTVVCNVSRTVVGSLRERYARVLVVLVTGTGRRACRVVSRAGSERATAPSRSAFAAPIDPGCGVAPDVTIENVANRRDRRQAAPRCHLRSTFQLCALAFRILHCARDAVARCPLRGSVAARPEHDVRARVAVCAADPARHRGGRGCGRLPRQYAAVRRDRRDRGRGDVLDARAGEPGDQARAALEGQIAPGQFSATTSRLRKPIRK